MSDLRFVLVDADNFGDIPDPAAAGARCQTCDYWERLDGHREPPQAGARSSESLKRSRLLSGERLAGSYAVLAYDGETAVGYAQFGPISNYPRAQSIRDRYPQLPDSPAPWVITCLQVVPGADDRDALGEGLLDATCEEIDRRGIVAVEAYPEGVPDGWLPSPGPAALYEANAFERVAGDDRFPVYRKELTGEGQEAGWDDLLRHTAPADDDRFPVYRKELTGEGEEASWDDLLRHTAPADDEDDWPFALPSPRDDDDLFRLPDRPRRPNPFGDD